MIRINLLPIRVSKKKQAGKQQLVFFALAVVFVLVCNFGWSQSRAATVAAREDKVKRTRAEIAQLEKIIGEVKNIKAQQAAVREKLGVLERLKAGRQGPVHVLDELSSITPKRLWLRKLEEQNGGVTFDGSASSIDDVSAFLAALKRSQHFSGPELKKTAGKRDGKYKLVDFTITAKVDYTPTVQVAAAVTPPAADGKR